MNKKKTKIKNWTREKLLNDKIKLQAHNLISYIFHNDGWGTF